MEPAERLSLQCPRAESSALCSAWRRPSTGRQSHRDRPRCPARRSVITRAQPAASSIDGDLSDEALADGNARVDTWYETEPWRQRRAEGQERRVSDLRRSIPLRRVRVRRSGRRRISARRTPIATTSATASTTTAASSSTPATPAAPRPSSSSRRTTSSTTPSPTTRQARTRRPTASGSRRRGSTTIGWTLEIRIPFSSLRYRKADPRRRGASCCTATIRAIAATSSSRRSCRAAATASSAARIRSSASSGCHRADTSSPRRTLTRQRGRAPARRRAGRRRWSTDPVKPHVGLDVKYTPNADHVARPDGESGLLAGRIRHRADFRERAVRAVLSGEAAVLPRRASISFRPRFRPSTPARSPRRAGAAGSPGKDGGVALHRARRRRCRRRQRDSAGAERIGVRVAGLRVDGVRRPREARARAVVRRRARHRSREARRQRPQPRRRPRLSVAARPAATSITGQLLVQQLAHAAARRISRTSGTGRRCTGHASLSCSGATTATHVDWFAHVQGFRRRLPRRQRLRAAGRLSRNVRDRRAGRSGRPDFSRVCAPSSTSIAQVDRIRRADQPQRDAGGSAWTAAGTASCSSATIDDEIRAGSRTIAPASVRLRRAVQPVAAVHADRGRRHARFNAIRTRTWRQLTHDYTLCIRPCRDV